MNHGDLVKVRGSHRLWVCLRVSKKDARRMNCDGPGLYLFGGYWYTTALGGPLNHKAYGKIDALQGRKVGRVRGHYAAKRAA